MSEKPGGRRYYGCNKMYTTKKNTEQEDRVPKPSHLERQLVPCPRERREAEKMK
jgi:hypothetical protein